MGIEAWESGIHPTDKWENETWGRNSALQGLAEETRRERAYWKCVIAGETGLLFLKKNASYELRVTLWEMKRYDAFYL